MSSVIERIPIDRVDNEAARISRALLTVVVGFFWLLGWLAGKVVSGVLFAFAAAKVGWLDARASAERSRGPGR